MTVEQHREWLSGLTQAEIDHAHEEYRRNCGESARDEAVRDTNAVLEASSRRA